MSEPTQQQAVSFAPTSPEVSVASRFAVAVSAVEVNLAVGRQRQVFQPNGEPIGGGVEYTHAFSVSPSAALQLVSILQFALAQYETSFGKIPVDPASVQKIADLEKAAEEKKAAPPTAKRAKRAK